MKSLGAQSLVRWGYGAIAALVVTMGWALYTAATDSRESALSVDHTLEVLGQIAEINDSLSRALSSHRGYLIYGQDRYLAQRDESMARAYDEIARVRALTSDNPSQQARLAALEDRVAKRRARMEANAEAKRIALERGVAEGPVAGSGQNITSAIHALTAAMKAEELRLLDERRIHQQERFAWAVELFGAVIVVMLLIAIPGYVAYSRVSRAKRRTERRIHELAESLPGAVFQFRTVSGGAGRYEFLSESTASLRGVDPKAALRDPTVLFDTIVAEDKDALFAALAAAGEALRPLVHDFRVKDKEQGGTRWIRVSSAPRRDADGTVLWSGHWGDVTEQKRMERQLHQAKDAADAANRAKSNFLATMSHEIRTPMYGVLGMLELLSLRKLDGEQRTTLEIVRESGRHLLRIIDDILDFSRIEAGKLELRPEPASIPAIVERVVNIYAGTASSKGLVLTRHVDRGLDVPVLADPVRLQQILNNFVSNAIKFTSSGDVAIRAELVEQRDAAQVVRFVVRDTGIGISAEEKKGLFQPFSQASEETAARYGGSGLGLSICRKLAEQMGGTVEMHSEPGAGTTMELNLTLPIAGLPGEAVPAVDSAWKSPVIARRALPTVAQAEEDGTLVLLVDDHPVNRMVLLKQLNALGYAAVTAENGREALEVWASGRFGALITDCNMPEMNGYDLARRVRDCESRHAHRRTPIIACTANALGGEAEKCFAAGMDDYLAKPIELSALAQKLQHWLALPERPDTAEKPIDGDVLAEISSGDPAFAGEILERFHRHNAEDTEMLLEAMRRCDIRRVTDASHRIKGASHTIGANALAAVCEHMERACKAEDWPAVAAQLDGFHREVRRLNEFIEYTLAQQVPQ